MRENNKIITIYHNTVNSELFARVYIQMISVLFMQTGLGHNMAAIRCAFQTLPTLRTPKTWII